MSSILFCVDLFDPILLALCFMEAQSDDLSFPRFEFQLKKDSNHIGNVAMLNNDLVELLAVTDSSLWEKSLQSVNYGTEMINLTLPLHESLFSGSQGHWQNPNMLRNFSLVLPPKVELTEWQQKKREKNKQIYARFLQKYSEGLATSGTSFERDLAVADSGKSENGSKSSGSKKKGKPSMSAMVRASIASSSTKKKFEQGETKLNNAIKLVGKEDDLSACLHFEALLAKLDLLPLLMVKAYIFLIDIRRKLNNRICLSDLGCADDAQVAAFVGLYLAIRDVERIYTSYLAGNEMKGTYEYLVNLLVEMGIMDFAKQVAQRGKVKFKSRSSVDQKISYSEFQLSYTSSHVIRDVGSKKDERVNFIPDLWQIEMLDAVDSQQSLLVSAPTSSGKTFVSYYTLGKILKENAESKRKKGRIVFVVPTKALVNQTSGDIYKRYGAIFAVYTREQKDDNYETAQVRNCFY